MFKNKIGISTSDRLFYICVNILMFLILFVVIIPILNVVSSSISEPSAVAQGRVLIFPQGFSLEGYKAVFRDKDIINSYGNSIFYTIFGTLINIIMTIICAYPLSRDDLKGRNIIMFLFTFTMMFQGGLIPNYLLIRDLKMIDTRWSMLIPGAISVYNMIVARTFFQSTIPKELLEATKIDGGSDFIFFFKVVIPLSKAIIAVLALYYAVSHWNAYFLAFLYLNDHSKFPLQLILREILIANSISSEMLTEGKSAVQNDLSEVLKYASIIVACLPIWIVYPMIQKYFVKGVMIGAIKG